MTLKSFIRECYSLKIFNSLMTKIKTCTKCSLPFKFNHPFLEIGMRAHLNSICYPDFNMKGSSLLQEKEHFTLVFQSEAIPFPGYRNS